VTPALPDGGNPGLSGVRGVLVVPARMTRSGLLASPPEPVPARRGRATARFDGIGRSWLRDPVKRWSRSAWQPGARSPPLAREHWHSPGVRAVATLLRVTEATARTYLDDEIIKDMARRMLFEVAGERPGADLIVPLS
jgi:hypothetical protein